MVIWIERIGPERRIRAKRAYLPEPCSMELIILMEYCLSIKHWKYRMMEQIDTKTEEQDGDQGDTR